MFVCRREEHLYLAGTLDMRRQGPRQSDMVPAAISLANVEPGRLD